MKPAILTAIKAHALADYPREACGLVVRIGRKEIYTACRNIAKGTSGFVLSPEDYAAAEDTGEILYIVHSHPDKSSRPSEADRVSCSEGDTPWFIVSVYKDLLNGGELVTDEGRLVKPDGYKAPLIGRAWCPPQQDCYGLVRDYYQERLGIELPDFELPLRAGEWWNDAAQSSLYAQHFEEAGFVRVGDGPREHDVILMNVRSVSAGPNHAGVYLGDNPCLMLHHLYGRPSCRVVYGGYYKDNTIMIVRHNQLLGDRT